MKTGTAKDARHIITMKETIMEKELDELILDSS